MLFKLIDLTCDWTSCIAPTLVEGRFRKKVPWKHLSRIGFENMYLENSCRRTVSKTGTLKTHVEGRFRQHVHWNLLSRVRFENRYLKTLVKGWFPKQVSWNLLSRVDFENSYLENSCRGWITANLKFRISNAEYQGSLSVSNEIFTICLLPFFL